MMINQYLFLLIISKLGNAVKNDFLKKENITNLATNTTLNAKINEVKRRNT